MEKFALQTPRLDIRPLEISDYEAWYHGFSQRKPAQNPFDEGQIDMSMCDINWYQRLLERHHFLWTSDDTYIFAVFDKAGHHIGMLNVATLARTNMQWGEIGYLIHNHHWRKGYAFEALTALLKLVMKN